MRSVASRQGAGSRRRLPACLLAAVAVFACGRADPEPAAAGGEGLFWEIPDPPAGIVLEVDGRVVDAELIRGFLMQPWTEQWDDALGEAECARRLLADPRLLFEPLVRGVVLLHEAERRWPEIEAEELEHFDAEMRLAVGAVHEALLRRLGAAGLRAHQEREIRKRRILAAFGVEAAPVSEDEVWARYEEMLGEVEQPELLVQRGLDFQELAPRIRADLENTRAVEAQEAWIDARLAQTRVTVRTPDGREISW